MNAIEVAQKVVAEKQAHVVRPRNSPGFEYNAKPYHGRGGGRDGWILVDLFSASAIVKVYEGLNAENKAKFQALSILKAAKVAMQLVK